MKILLQFMIFKRFHHTVSIYCFLLVEWNELEVFRVLRNIFERTFNRIKIMSSNRCILSGATKSIMKFLLSCNKSLVGFLVKVNISEDCSCNKWPNLFDLHKLFFTDGSTTIVVVGLDSVTFGVVICSR